MELQHFSHQHPLAFSEERSHESDKVHCSGCGELVSGPNFSCVQCGFYLDKQCAEAPSQMNHPFHSNHSFNLLKKHPYTKGECRCDFCGQTCENFVYHCSCDLDLHIKCALFSYNIAQRKVDHLQHIDFKDPSISSENLSQELKKAVCFACRMPLVVSPYLSLDCGFSLHKKCIELPLEISHLCHRKHSLFLQFNSRRLPCQICLETQNRGLVYCCSICKFVVHIECILSPSPIIEGTSSHEHPFTLAKKEKHPFTRLLLPQSSFTFTCDACGTSGNSACYVCSTCSLIVHKKCISLPHFIKHTWHYHPMLHKYFLVDNECGTGTMECGFCHEEVNKECGSYYCSHCNFVFHVNCALKKDWRYYEIEKKEDYEKALVADTGDPPFSVVKDIKDGENIVMNTEIKHFSHEHNLVLSEVVKDDDRYCDCCSLLITTSFYLCLQCHFFLHKSCAELPRKKQVMVHSHQDPHNLTPNCYFKCTFCNLQCSGFAYKCTVCGKLYCVRCAEISVACKSQGHKHLLLLYLTSGKQCNACGKQLPAGDYIIYRCKGCDFNVHVHCTYLPQTARHKCDEHLLTLKYHEDNDYSKYLYCDICEEDRNPNLWFYHCAICDTSAHHRCVLGEYPFVKLGTTLFIDKHPHRLVVVRKVYDYPECCDSCGKQCSDEKALECLETGCNYIKHLKRCVG